jgi:hypothetical protein
MIDRGDVSRLYHESQLFRSRKAKLGQKVAFKALLQVSCSRHVEQKRFIMTTLNGCTRLISRQGRRVIPQTLEDEKLRSLPRGHAELYSQPEGRDRRRIALLPCYLRLYLFSY